MPRRRLDAGWTPPLYHDKANQKGRVRFPGGHDRSCGRWPAHVKEPPPEVLQRYRALIAEWQASHAPPPRVPEGISVNELVDRFLGWAEAEYRTRGGKPDAEWWCYTALVPHLIELYGEIPAAEFGPAQLQALQRHFVGVTWTNKANGRSGKWCRGYINEQVARVRRMWNWGVGQGLLPLGVAQALGKDFVRPLKRGKTSAPESKRRQIPTRADVEATLPFLAPPLPELVRIHWLIGCRANQVVLMRPCEIDRSADPACWLWVPSVDKMEARDEGPEEARYWLGPKCQAILTPLLERLANAPEIPDSSLAYLFPVNPRGCRFGKGVGSSYTKDSYNTAVQRAIRRGRKAGVAIGSWSVGAIRHGRATEVRLAENAAGRHGRESAGAVLGHEESEVTARYANHQELAKRVQAEMG